MTVKGLLAILAPKGKSPGGMSKGMPSDDEEAEGDEPESSESSEDEYGDVLADMLGVAKEDREAFNDALSGFVRQCMQK